MIRKLLPLLLLIFIQSCYYNNLEDMYPEQPVCDTQNVSYALDIQPLLQSRCYGCHSNANAPFAGNNIKLEDYQDVKEEADEGSLLGVISHETGYPPMPRGSSKLDDCSISKVSAWIEDNSPNN